MPRRRTEWIGIPPAPRGAARAGERHLGGRIRQPTRRRRRHPLGGGDGGARRRVDLAVVVELDDLRAVEVRAPPARRTASSAPRRWRSWARSPRWHSARSKRRRQLPRPRRPRTRSCPRPRARRGRRTTRGSRGRPSITVKSTATSAPASSSASGVARDVESRAAARRAGAGRCPRGAGRRRRRAPARARRAPPGRRWCPCARPRRAPRP